ncbi:hypothetical protein C7B65_09350 [Phormidesmis priestleyi ULC007]|uniref:Uncharacterized protein n=1 Tax=Phormidesmis priestleyi ULC007 TaxID=1920490 RepID=A0A2T1DHA7_9CYAN|nr:hypothetical protein [Phormidesmis priestleyi]PSB19872.1 hypothetical protein C7B65_09350 [Phormidesmis priestleyi ULC007]PZO49199.1 MAG: hypothetical protein DCF14_14750 [Phormidesmis priestleyi]
MSEINSDLNPSQSYDAQQVSEEIAEGSLPAPKVDVSADYEASKEFSVSEIDRADEGEKAAQAASAHAFEVHETEPTHAEAEPTGDPSDFRNMAKSINHDQSTAGNVDDDLIHKAIEKGQPSNHE